MLFNLLQMLPVYVILKLSHSMQDTVSVNVCKSLFWEPQVWYMSMVFRKNIHFDTADGKGSSDTEPNVPAHEIMALITQATSEGSGAPANPRSLARAFAVRTHEV